MVKILSSECEIIKRWSVIMKKKQIRRKNFWNPIFGYALLLRNARCTIGPALAASL